MTEDNDQAAAALPEALAQADPETLDAAESSCTCHPSGTYKPDLTDEEADRLAEMAGLTPVTVTEDSLTAAVRHPAVAAVLTQLAEGHGGVPSDLAGAIMQALREA